MLLETLQKWKEFDHYHWIQQLFSRIQQLWRPSNEKEKNIKTG
jgi:hypothetical protein